MKPSATSRARAAFGVVLHQQIENGGVSDMLGEIVGAGEFAAGIASTASAARDARPCAAREARSARNSGRARRVGRRLGDEQVLPW